MLDFNERGAGAAQAPLDDATGLAINTTGKLRRALNGDAHQLPRLPCLIQVSRRHRRVRVVDLCLKDMACQRCDSPAGTRKRPLHWLVRPHPLPPICF